MLNIFLNTWGNYNENGADGGEWITLPMDEDELQKIFDRIAEAMGDHDPEWFINDYEWTGEIHFENVGEMDSITKWNIILQDVDGLDEYDQEQVAAAMDAFGYSLAEAVDKMQRGSFIFYNGQELIDVAHDLVETCYFEKDTPDIFTRYFDYEAFARDLGFDGYEETEWGVICEC